MRVTASMMKNNMLINHNRHMRNVDTLWQQFSTTRRIQRPSDNPLIAARHMKFQANIRANEDFQRNVENALGWMDVTDAALDGVLRYLMDGIRDTINRSANDFNALDDRQALAVQLRHLKEQIGHQMNAQFAGRHVFAGLRTNQPPVFTQHQPNVSFEITQHFTLENIERTRSLQIFPPRSELVDPDDPSLGYRLELPTTHEIHILKLAYNHVDTFNGLENGPPMLRITAADGSVFDANDPMANDVLTFSKNDRGAYGPIAPGTVHFIRETGELIFYSGDVTGGAGSDLFPVSVTYNKSNFQRGELNPIVHFETRLLYAPPGHTLFDQHMIGQFFNMERQDLIYEFSTHTTIPVNTLAKNVLTDKLFADLTRLVDFMDSIQPTSAEQLRALYEAPPFNLTGIDLQNAIYSHQADENSFINNVINDRFNNMLFLIDRHAAGIRQELTDLGSRGRRLELFQNRLEQDEGSLERLYTHNIAVDMARITSLMATAEAQLMAAALIGRNIINVTLANFLDV